MSWGKNWTKEDATELRQLYKKDNATLRSLFNENKHCLSLIQLMEIPKVFRNIVTDGQWLRKDGNHRALIGLLIGY